MKSRAAMVRLVMLCVGSTMTCGASYSADPKPLATDFRAIRLTAPEAQTLDGAPGPLRTWLPSSHAPMPGDGRAALTRDPAASARNPSVADDEHTSGGAAEMESWSLAVAALGMILFMARRRLSE